MRVRLPPLPSGGWVRQREERSGREPDDCGFDSHSSQFCVSRAVGRRGRRRPRTSEIGVRLPDGPSMFVWKVAGYGWPGHGANVCVPRGTCGFDSLTFRILESSEFPTRNSELGTRNLKQKTATAKGALRFLGFEFRVPSSQFRISSMRLRVVPEACDPTKVADQVRFLAKTLIQLGTWNWELGTSKRKQLT